VETAGYKGIAMRNYTDLDKDDFDSKQIEMALQGVRVEAQEARRLD
jgi:hypothetical protein